MRIDLNTGNRLSDDQKSGSAQNFAPTSQPLIRQDVQSNGTLENSDWNNTI